MTIDLPPDLERALAEEARRQGTTPESLAHDIILKGLLADAGEDDSGTLADLLAGHIGVLNSSSMFRGEPTCRKIRDASSPRPCGGSTGLPQRSTPLPTSPAAK